MNGFLDKWNNDSKFKVKVQLVIYTGFVLIALIFALASRSTINYDDKLPAKNDKEESIITIPKKYNYSIDIAINNKNYRYEGKQSENEETITKIVDNQTRYYIKKDNVYYQGTNIMNGSVSQEEVYDMIDYSYLNLNTINQYLTLSKKQNNLNLVYLKDIIIGNASEQYITIEVKNNKINIDYTSLLQLFDKTIERCNIEYVIEEIE